MKKRVLALVCCLSLTLGLFTYRPPEAKAIVTEASLATSVLWSFMQSAGITFNGTGMNSSSWAEAIEPYLRDFTEWKDSAAESFWHWLGYDGASEFIKALSWSKITHPTTMPFPSVVIPPAVAKKMGEFTHWFAEKVGLMAGSKPVTVVGSSLPKKVADIVNACQSYMMGKPDYFYNNSNEYFLLFKEQAELPYIFYSVDKPHHVSLFHSDGTNKLFPEKGYYVISETVTKLSVRQFRSLDTDSWDSGGSTSKFSSFGDVYGLFICPDGEGVFLSDSSIAVTQPGALSPTFDDKGEKPTVVAYPNINGDLSSINDLLQQILDKLAANDLNSSASLEGEAAPDVPATDIGWKGTIEKIYQGIIDLPGRIADAFKTLLEGLFAPDAALMQEIATTFTDKFPFLPVLNRVGNDLFGMTADSEPPVIWVHLEKAEGKYYYGEKQKILDMSFYQRYKADGDKLISGFLWLGFLWLLFKRASAIIQGGEMLTEYSEAIDRGYRERKGKKTK